jgi:uncharacterized protein YcbX
MSRKKSNMHVAEIWRYPVKSMAGEQLKSIQLNMDGIQGDRRVLVYNEGTRQLITSRTHPKLLGLKATLNQSGQVFVDGHAWDSPETTEVVVNAAGPHARLLEWDGMERFDVLPLLVATDGAIKEFGYDHRRLRPNLVIGGVDGLAEREWPGLRMKIGNAVIEFAQLRGRCVMTTYDPDTQKKDPKVLRHIVEKFDGTLALDTDVIQAGQINVGDPVELIK